MLKQCVKPGECCHSRGLQVNTNLIVIMVKHVSPMSRKEGFFFVIFFYCKIVIRNT